MSDITPEIKAIFSPDLSDVEKGAPENPSDFCVLLQIMIGEEGIEGADSFEIVVCTPRWIEERISKGGVFFLDRYIVVQQYDYIQVRSFIEKFMSKCRGKDWEEVAGKLSRIG